MNDRSAQENESPEDPFAHLAPLEARLEAIRQKIPENPFETQPQVTKPQPASVKKPERPLIHLDREAFGPEPRPSKFKNNKKSAESYAESSQAIGRGFEIYAHVITGSLMIMIPPVAGYFVDERFGVVLFAPIGIVVGMISGLGYLIRLSNRSSSGSDKR